MLFSCQKNSEIAINTKSSEISETKISESKVAHFAENLSFEKNEMKNFLKNPHKKIIISRLMVPILFSNSSEFWQEIYKFSEIPNDILEVEFEYAGTAFDDLSEVKKYFLETNPHSTKNGIVRLNGDFSDNEILELFEILDKIAKDAEFIVIENLHEKHLQNPQIAEKFQKYQAEFAKKFPKNVSVNLEMNWISHYDFENNANYIDDSDKIFINTIFEEKKWEVHRFVKRYFDNLTDFEEFVNTSSKKIFDVKIGKSEMWIYNFLFPLKNSPEKLYSDEIFSQILEILQKFGKIDNENFRIFGLKKVHFENEKILEILSNFEAKNLRFPIEYNSSFELSEQFYTKLLNAKTTNTITFDVFGVWIDTIFCNFRDKNDKIHKIISRNEKPYLFCLNAIGKGEDIPGNEKTRELLEQFSQ